MIFEYIYGRDVSHNFPHVEISIECITPEVAQKMLNVNIDNRDFKREPLVEALKNGEWALNGETIIFSDEGTLLDGQNRLLACVKSGIPIVTIVVRGIPKEAQVTMDAGARRIVRDFLKMWGVENYSLVGAIGTGLYRSNHNGVEKALYTDGHSATTMSQLNYIMENIDRIQYLITKIRKTVKMKGVNAATIGVLADLFYSVNDHDADYFFKQLDSACPCVQPIALLRNTLLTNAAKKEGKFSQRYIGAIIAKTWNAYMEGREIKCLKFAQGGASPEQFPPIYGIDYSN